MTIISNMSANMFEMGTAALKGASTDPQLRQLVREHPVVAVGRYRHEPAAFVVAPDVFNDLERARDELARIRETLPLLLTAIHVGVAIPSETLDRLGVSLEDDSWVALNRFQATVTVRLQTDEHGAVPSRGSLAGGEWFGESDDELVAGDD